MSYSTVLGVTADRKPIELATLRNAHCWAPLIWGDLLESRGHGRNDWGILRPKDENPLEELWKEIESLDACEQAALLLTFDTGVVPFLAFEWAAESLREFESRYNYKTRRVAFNHVDTVATIFESSPEVPFVGIWGTSVTDNPFEPWACPRISSEREFCECDDLDDDYPEHYVGLPFRDFYILERHREMSSRPTANYEGNNHE